MGGLTDALPIAFSYHANEVFQREGFVEPKPYFVVKQFYENWLVKTCLFYDRGMSHAPEKEIAIPEDREMYDPRFLLPCFCYVADRCVFNKLSYPKKPCCL